MVTNNISDIVNRNRSGLMQKLFEVCFATGAIFTVVSFILSHLHGFNGPQLEGGLDGGLEGLDAGADIDLGIDVDSSIDADVSGTEVETSIGTVSTQVGPVPVSPLKPVVLASFITVFGGVGMICQNNGFDPAIAAVIAGVSGISISYVLYRFLVVPLYRAQNTSAVSQRELKGGLAKAVLSMKNNEFGKITYAVAGNTYSAPAKSIDGVEIKSGADVVIIDIKKNVFYVKQIKGGMLIGQ